MDELGLSMGFYPSTGSGRFPREVNSNRNVPTFMTRVIDFAKRENAAGGPSDPDIIAARFLRQNCGATLETQKK